MSEITNIFTVDYISLVKDFFSLVTQPAVALGLLVWACLS